jgi:hypothetical protein
MLSSRMWWVVTLPVIALGFYLSTFALILKNKDDIKTKKRGIAVSEACRKINENYLGNSDVKIKCGDYSAWLEVSYDVNKSKLFFESILVTF